jgi:putative alpha-1,2-mannosidase
VYTGTDQYAIGSPLFKKTTITLEDEKKFVIESLGNSPKNVYIESVYLNGEKLSRSGISYSDTANGGKLTLVIGNKPNKERGTGQEDRPYLVSRDGHKNIMSSTYRK